MKRAALNLTDYLDSAQEITTAVPRTENLVFIIGPTVSPEDQELMNHIQVEFLEPWAARHNYEIWHSGPNGTYE